MVSSVYQPSALGPVAAVAAVAGAWPTWLYFSNMTLAVWDSVALKLFCRSRICGHRKVPRARRGSAVQCTSINKQLSCKAKAFRVVTAGSHVRQSILMLSKKDSHLNQAALSLNAAVPQQAPVCSDCGARACTQLTNTQFDSLWHTTKRRRTCVKKAL